MDVGTLGTSAAACSHKSYGDEWAQQAIWETPKGDVRIEWRGSLKRMKHITREKESWVWVSYGQLIRDLEVWYNMLTKWLAPPDPAHLKHQRWVSAGFPPASVGTGGFHTCRSRSSCSWSSKRLQRHPILEMGELHPQRSDWHLWQSLEKWYSTVGIRYKYYIYKICQLNGLMDQPVVFIRCLNWDSCLSLQVDAGIRSADILMCSEPPFFCKMFLGQRLSYKATNASGVMHEMKAFTRPPESSEFDDLYAYRETTGFWTLGYPLILLGFVKVSGSASLGTSAILSAHISYQGSHRTALWPTCDGVKVLSMQWIH